MIPLPRFGLSASESNCRRATKKAFLLSLALLTYSQLESVLAPLVQPEQSSTLETSVTIRIPARIARRLENLPSYNLATGKLAGGEWEWDSAHHNQSLARKDVSTRDLDLAHERHRHGIHADDLSLHSEQRSVSEVPRAHCTDVQEFAELG